MDSKLNTQTKCQICYSQPYLDAQKLCPSCEEYANQDYVSGTGETWTDHRLNKYKSIISGQPTDSPWSPSGGLEHPVYQIIFEARLTEKQKQALELYYFEGRSISEIAEKMKITKGAIQSYLDRARKKLEETARKFPQLKPIVKAKSRLDPYEYYSQCPKCGAAELEAVSEIGGECTCCNWRFNVTS